MAVPAVRTPVLRSAGWALVLDEPLEPADAIVVVVGGDRATLLEAADLVRAGISPRVALLSDPPDDADRELMRRGVTFEDETAAATRLLHRLGVAHVDRISKSAAGTEEIGRILPEWCEAQGYDSVAVISPPDHSRRTRRVLDRSMKGRPAKVRVRVARHSTFDPDRWWHTRDGIRTEIVELQKLLLDLVRHPLS
jgi:hypothetical protein